MNECKAFYAIGSTENLEVSLPQSTVLTAGKWELAVASIVHLDSFEQVSPLVIQTNICHSDYINFHNQTVDCKTVLQQHLSHTENQSSLHFNLVWHPVNRATQYLQFCVRDASGSATVPKPITKKVLCNIHFFLKRIA